MENHVSFDSPRGESPLPRTEGRRVFTLAFTTFRARGCSRRGGHGRRIRHDSDRGHRRRILRASAGRTIVDDAIDVGLCVDAVTGAVGDRWGGAACSRHVGI